MAANFYLTGTRTLYASRCGAVLNGSLSSCTGTDDRAAIQAAIDQLEAAGGGTLVVDGAAALGGALLVGSNVRVAGNGPSTGFCMLAGSGGTAIRNRNWVSGYNAGSPVYDGSTIVDRNIAVENLFINGGLGVGSGGGAFGDQFNSAGQYAAAAQFFGVKYLSVRNVTILDACAFGIHNCNVFVADFVGCKVLNSSCLSGTNPNRQGDGIDLFGPVRYVNITDFTCATADDAVSLCSDGWQLLADTGDHLRGPTAFGGAGGWANVFRGPVQDVTVKGVNSIYSMTAFRLFSGYGNIAGGNSNSQVIDRVTFSDVSGTYFHGIGHLQLQGLNVGNIGSVTVDNADVSIVSSSAGDYLLGTIDGACRSLTLRNVKRRDLSGATNQYVYVTGSVGSLLIENADTYEDTDATGCPLVKIGGGSVQLLRVANSSWVRKSGLTPSVQTNPLVQCTGSPSIGTIQLSGIATDAVRNVALFDSSFAGSVGRVIADGIAHVNTAGTDGLVRNDSPQTIPVKSGSNVTSGVATQNTGAGAITAL